MKAIYFERYGKPEKVLKVKELDRPNPLENQILVKVYATSINDYDWSQVRGKPLIYRLMFGLIRPKQNISGMEFSGVVEGIGPSVKHFKVGDAVFGDISETGFGTFAEYICVNEKSVTSMPDGLSFEEATALPHALTLAFQALVDIGKMGKGQNVLINGGGGGVGSLGLQIAKLYDCEVTGVDIGHKLAMMTSLGYDHVIDYQTNNFTKAGIKYDLILDCKTGKSPFAYLRALKPNGRYVTIGGRLSKLISLSLLSKIISLLSSKKLHILSLKANKDLAYLSEVFIENKFTANIDGPYSFEDIPGLIQYFGEGKHSGKIVVRIAN
ncbi:NAD(P)-dependent alcohol dehydrogenase [Membranihabitans marinus]|uniref:NAD(P)-dependent alcohol dehydrogenase n=1 Tax=Membranihabitans marinus TaxID=1227546 RepID=UPI001F2AD602|nr:NAD(P)-dependent alcohol dehydrogenase [Membranihabitans marinus]